MSYTQKAESDHWGTDQGSRSLRENTRGTFGHAKREPVRRFTNDYTHHKPIGFMDLLDKAKHDRELGKRRLLASKSFVPRRVNKRLHAELDGETPEVAETMVGAVLFADVSGFTALSEKLKKEWEELIASDESPDWSPSEKLCQKLNAYWKVVIDNTHKYGGDVIKFSGDAITVLFIGDKAASAKSGGYICPDVPSATLRAVQCSEKIHVETQRFAPELTLHMGIGAGNFTGVFVGGAFGRMEYILAGQPMKQVSIAEPIAVSGETGISPQAFELLPEYCAVGELVTDLPDEYYAAMPIKKTEGSGDAAYQREKRRSGHREAIGYRLFGRGQFKDADPPPPIPPDDVSDATVDQWTAQLKKYIPAAVTDDKLTLAESDHLAENLTVSVIFISIDGIELGAETPEEAPAIGKLAQRLMLRIQEAIYQWEGSVNKLMVDDKGLLVLCALGLPPMGHGDDPFRAVSAALDIPGAIKRVHPDAVVKVGVSSGQAFCGIVGHSELRREYTVMGPLVNLCARLMTSAKPGQVLVCEQTKLAVGAACDFSDPVALHMKGIGTRNTYSPIAKPREKKKDPKEKKKPKKKDYDKMLFKLMMGRDDEVASLHSMLGRSKICGGGLILITGERGQGKSFMLDQAWAIADESWATMIRFQSEADKSKKAVMAFNTYKDYEALFEANGEHYDAAYATSVYPAWRGVISIMVEDGAKRASQTVVEWVQDALMDWEDGGLQEHLSLLMEFLPLGTECNPNTDAETAREVMRKHGATLELIGDLLCTVMWRYGMQNGPTLVKIHLQKNSSVISTFNEIESWTLLKRVTDLRCNIVVVVGTRSFSPADARNPVVKKILDDCQMMNSVLDLKNFATKHSMKFAAQLLSSREVQNYPHIGKEAERGLAPTETYTITKEDLPEELKTMLGDVAQGNPKNILEVLDPLLSGYNKPTDYISPSTVKKSDDWSHPIISITGNHEIKINDNPATMQPYNLDEFPWPLKLVAHVEQTYQELQDDRRNILKMASIFPIGFTAELMRPFIETFQEADLRELVGHGFLMKLGAEWFTDSEWHELVRMDPTVTTAFCFSSTLLQRLISGRIVQREREHLDRVKQKAIVRCRWMRLFKGWTEMRRARDTLEKHGFKVTLRTHHRKDSLLINEAKDHVENLRVVRRKSIGLLSRNTSEASLGAGGLAKLQEGLDGASSEAENDADHILSNSLHNITVSKGTSGEEGAAAAAAPAAALVPALAASATSPSAAFMLTYMLIGAVLALIAQRFIHVDGFVESLGKSLGLW